MCKTPRTTNNWWTQLTRAKTSLALHQATQLFNLTSPTKSLKSNFNPFVLAWYATLVWTMVERRSQLTIAKTPRKLLYGMDLHHPLGGKETRRSQWSNRIRCWWKEVQRSGRQLIEISIGNLLTRQVRKGQRSCRGTRERGMIWRRRLLWSIRMRHRWMRLVLTSWWLIQHLSSNTELWKRQLQATLDHHNLNSKTKGRAKLPLCLTVWCPTQDQEMNRERVVTLRSKTLPRRRNQRTEWDQWLLRKRLSRKRMQVSIIYDFINICFRNQRYYEMACGFKFYHLFWQTSLPRIR